MDVGTVIKQQFHEGAVIASRSNHQSRRTVRVRRINLCAGFEKLLCAC